MAEKKKTQLQDLNSEFQESRNCLFTIFIFLSRGGNKFLHACTHLHAGYIYCFLKRHSFPGEKLI